MLLAGKCVLITGAGRGNGEAIARGLAKEGARLVLVDIDLPSVRALADDLDRSGAEAWAWPVDVADAEACAALSGQVLAEVGPVDVLINNAGICPRNTIDAPDMREAWHRGMSINLDGTLNMVLAFVGQLRAQRGVIINMTSIAAFVSTATSVSYSTSKAAIRMLTQNLAQELAADGVRVNAIAPGTIATTMTEATRHDPDRSARFLSRIPMGRFGEPEELVGPVLFLASSMSSYVTGTTLVVDGGYLAV